MKTAIAGHRGYHGKSFFLHLPEVTAGDEVYLKTDSQTFIYEIDRIQTIKPSQVEIVQDSNDKNEITLITCTISGINRIAVQGSLMEVIQREDSVSESSSAYLSASMDRKN
ncbi:sortase [Bacillaceae bacterium Marseille-Q3522]|nr:sortase [Bacillaceae bacterium Marseille-Q3522]